MPEVSRRTAPFAASLVLALGVGLPGQVRAEEQYRATEAEKVLLPPLCQARLNREEWARSKKRWESVIGPDAHHIHHYCYSLVFINRAKSETTNRRARKTDLDAAQGEIGYVLERTTDGSMLAPDFHLTKGEISVLAGEPMAAVKSYRKATQIRPNYPKSWLALSDLYKQMGMQQQAREALEQGLKAAPEKFKDYMKKRLAELDANASSPSPAAVAPQPDTK